MLKIVNNNMKIDSLHMGQTSKFAVELKNDGSEEINIWQVKPGCGECTKVILENAVLAPGQTTFLRVAFTPISTGSYPKIVKFTYKTGKSQANKEVIFTFNVSVAS